MFPCLHAQRSGNVSLWSQQYFRPSQALTPTAEDPPTLKESTVPGHAHSRPYAQVFYSRASIPFTADYRPPERRHVCSGAHRRTGPDRLHARSYPDLVRAIAHAPPCSILFRIACDSESCRAFAGRPLPGYFADTAYISNQCTAHLRLCTRTVTPPASAAAIILHR